MVQKIIKIFKSLKATNRQGYYFKKIFNSTITIINRKSFEIGDDWFNSLLTISYDEEIKCKYIPELHECNYFERKNLTDILNFQQWLELNANKISVCEDYINRFKGNYRDFVQLLEVEEINITNSEHQFICKIKTLNDSFNSTTDSLLTLKALFNAKGYSFLSSKNDIDLISNPILELGLISFKQKMWAEFLDKEPQNFYILNDVINCYNQIFEEFNALNRMLGSFKSNTACKIIAGNAGTGKTHMSAHLVEKIKSNGDYVLFFKPKQFNGDNINLNERLLQLLQVPKGYTLNEILEKINGFALTHKRRCFLIIDALNETTKSSIGFSSIWKDHLQEFINQIGLFSHLYLVCTLRTSYIDQIWNTQPHFLSEIKGFDRPKDLQALCDRYFDYYNINVLNRYIADLSIFRIPLLLDLYCKLINESRTRQKDIKLDMSTYLQIFEDYIQKVSTEVQHKLGLQKKKPINVGFSLSSESFYQNNEAIIPIDEFSDAFDKDDNVTIDKSIARAVLDGYLIFIKDIINRNDEIVKHTQQEVGGYLLAKYLSDKFSSIEDLLDNKEFTEKVLQISPDKQHQLRLDILKFLIAIRPEIIPYLKGSESLKLSWWYLYNGFNPNQGNDIPNFLLASSSKDFIIEVLKISLNHWLNIDNEFNFDFIAKMLEKLDLWSFDLSWTFFIYKEADFFYGFVEEHIKRGREGEYNKTASKLITFLLATTIRELRDLATIYLIEFGKKNPFELFELTEYSIRLADKYIYERLSSCCYGVSLILQNNDNFVQNVLPVIAQKAFQLQFAEVSIQPVFNYIIIDSYKHLIDLAVFKGVFYLSDSDQERINKYQFKPKHNWVTPTKEQLDIINKSDEMSWPEPIGMDFGIYTIPRLIDDEYENKREVIANVYKRIFELGYQSLGSKDFNDTQFSDFYFGLRAYLTGGKLDRLGKKYSWKGFFDYAGVLLLDGKLDVFNNFEKGHYQRLSDVDIDICIPFKDYKIPLRLYERELIIDQSSNPKWYTEVKIDSVQFLFEYFFFGNAYIMLHGMIDQRINKEFKTRSYLLSETFFIQKNEHFEKAREVRKITFNDWNLDNHSSRDHLRKVYFGELYWADSIGERENNSVFIPTGEKILIKKRVQPPNIFQKPIYKQSDINEIEENYYEKINFQSQPTLAEFLWESDSLVLNGYSEYYPSIKMGKSLGLKADPISGKILDSDLKDCFNCIEFKDQFFENKFSYMRSDLLRKYMHENNLALLYQIKQHSYDEGYGNRSMKYFIFE